MSEPTPNLATQPGEELLAELADEFLRRFREGEHPSIDEYAEKHPELADRIRDLFPAVIVMEQPSAGVTFDFTPPTERVGAMIGRYKLLERIGEGGFGVVYMAEQQHPVRRKVAVKVIKPGLDTRQVIARFEAERQALALMEHENIAKVLDAGATDSGRPYFVMELVHGVPITEFCDKNELPTRERLELFVQVCRAVQHAHTKGIIHRDIKPTNVLLTLHEGVPVPKVIDFGVAKATGQQLTEKTLFTHFAQLVGTPLYMSPEQAEMTSVDVDTRSDVFSLGVLLYELLTGTTPLDKERLKQAAFDEVRRIIREDEPPRPSARLSTMGQQAGRSISAQQKTDLKQLGRLMRGELDWIVMKAMCKERARRYETASAFAADVQRYLRNEPVEACPPSAWYRFRKFARRRKDVLAGAAAVAAMIFVAAGILVVSNVRVSGALERERRNSYAQRIALADREWTANNLSGMEALLEDCPPDLRGWEWHYLKRLRHSAIRPLHHDNPVVSVAFSHDGESVATGNQAGFLTLWSTKTKQAAQAWKAHREDVSSVVFSADGRYVASGSWDGTVKVWELGKILRDDIDEPALQWDQTSRVWCVAFSPDCKRLAAAIGRTTEERGELKVWDLNSRQAVLSMSFATRVSSVQFSADGRQLATVSGELLQVWDAQTGQEQLACRDPAGNLQSVTFSPDGRRLATVGGLIAVAPDREIKVWDARTGQEMQSLRGHVGGLASVAFSSDGQRLASAGLDQTVKLWDTATGQEVLTLRGHRDVIRWLAFSADGHQLATASLDNTVRIWDASSLEPPTEEHLTLRGHKGPATDVKYHPDGGHLVSAGTDGTLRIWDTSNGKQKDVLRGTPSFLRVNVAYSPDGNRLASVHPSPQRTPMTMWDVANSKELDGFRANASSALCVTFSPDGRHVASAGFDWVVRVYDSTTGQELQILEDHHWPIFGVAFSPDGLQLASGSSDGTVRVWDWTNGQVIRILESRHTARIQSVAYSSEGDLLASGSCDRTIKLWNTATWELEHDLSDPTGAILCVTFGDERRLGWGSTDSTVKVWDGPGTETHILRGHTSWVQAVAFSPDGKWIASASLDGTVKIWHAPRKSASAVAQLRRG